MMSSTTATCTAMKNAGRSPPTKPGEDGKAGGGKDGAHRDDASERENYGKDPDRGQRSPGSGDEKNAESRGDAFAAVKAQPNRIHVTDDGEERCKRLSVRGASMG